MSRYRWLLALVLVLAATALATAVSGEGLELDRFDDITKTAGELESVTYNFTLKYAGAQSQAYVDVYLFDEPQGWTHVLEGTSWVSHKVSVDWIRLWMGQGEEATVVLTVTPGEGCRGGLYVLTVFANVEGEISLHDSAPVHVAFPDVYGHTARLIDKAPEGWSGHNDSTVLVRTEINNTGNIDDYFEVAATLHPVSQWFAVDLVEGLDSDWMTHKMLPGSSHVVTMAVMVSPLAPHGTDVTLHIRIVPAIGPDDDATDLGAKITVDGIPGLRAAVEGGRIWKVDPQKEAGLSTDIRVTNGWSQGTSVTTTIKVSSPSNGLTATVTPASQFIDSGSRYAYNLSVQLPSDCLAGTYLVWISFRSADFPNGITVELEVRVEQYHDVVVDPVSADLIVDLGYTPRITFNITNGGNGATLVYIWPHTLPLEWYVYLNPPRMSLRSGEMNSAEFVIVLPTDTSRGPRGPMEIMFRVEELDGDEELVTIRIFIPGWYQLEWMGKDGPITDPDFLVAPPNAVLGGQGITLNPAEQTRMNLSVNIKNLGPVNTTAHLEATSDTHHIRVDFEEEQVFVQGKEVVAVALHLVYYETIEAGSYTIELSLTSWDDPDAEARVARITIDVYTIDVLAYMYNYTGLYPEPYCPVDWFADEGTGIKFRYYVKDIGSTPAENVLVEFLHSLPNGTGELVGDWVLPTIEDGIQYYEYVWVARGLGDHGFYVRITAANQTNTDNDGSGITFKVLPKANGNGGNGGSGGNGGTGGNGGNGGTGGNGGGGGPEPGTGGDGDDPFHVEVSRTGLAILLVTVAVFTTVGLWRYSQFGRRP